MKLYLAAPFEELERLRIIRLRVHTETPQHLVVSSWLEKNPGSVGTPDSTWPTLALLDLGEIKACNILLLDTFATNDRGGSQVEFGYATAYGKQVWLVGPVRNVFNSIAQRQFANWDQAIEALKLYQ